MGTDDPAEQATTRQAEQPDRYEVTDWEERSRLDGFAVALYRFGTVAARGRHLSHQQR